MEFSPIISKIHLVSINKLCDKRSAIKTLINIPIQIVSFVQSTV